MGEWKKACKQNRGVMLDLMKFIDGMEVKEMLERARVTRQHQAELREETEPYSSQPSTR